MNFCFPELFLIFGYDFEKFFSIYGWYFYDLNGTPPYHKNSSYPTSLPLARTNSFQAAGNMKLGDRDSVACVQTLLIPFQTGSPPVESAHQQPNPCSQFMRNVEPFLIGWRISPFFHERPCLSSSLQLFN